MNAHDEFRKDIEIGLTKHHKSIASKYLYDEKGCQLFNKITRHPDYYLTNCEINILNQYRSKLIQFFLGHEFNVIELGPGEGIKTQLILEEFIANNLSFTYIPIDISIDYLQKIAAQFKKNLPTLPIHLINSDYFHGIEKSNLCANKKNLVLFLGSSIGNYDRKACYQFLHQLKKHLKQNDYLFIGFDLIKDTDILIKAYDDSAGITRDFNFNLLHRINRELNGNFDLKQFCHDATFNSNLSAMESHLVSLKKQTIQIKGINSSILFDRGESIHVEYSFKYSPLEITQIAKTIGFEVVDTFFDSKKYFANSLWRIPCQKTF